MDEQGFALRLAKLRMDKGVSARDMSLSLGQNAGYINNIESGKALPSMSSFFYICDYLGISPQDFFDTDTAYPDTLCGVIEDLKRLDRQQLENIASIVKGLIR